MINAYKALKFFLLLILLVILISGCSKTAVETVDTTKLQQELEHAKELVSQKNTSLYELDQKYKRLQWEAAKTNEKLNELQQQINTLEAVQHNFSIIKGDIIPLHNWKQEINLVNILGEPLSEELTSLSGDGFSGTFIKEVNYEGLKIVLFSPDGDSYWIMKMDIVSNEYMTPKGIKVGDHIDAAKQAYPNLTISLDGISKENIGFYELTYDYNYLIFKVENSFIKSIHLKYEMP
ncbi:hypothetical protein ACFSCX_19480 [Bacillus salitolerans]|uniref:Uncharacterized protein n=1 Tax=Bacillus salitolerans TaxID=1437434 RepID=A0ABW4LX21_9BACI